MVVSVGNDSLEHGDQLGFFQHVTLDGLQKLIPGHLKFDHKPTSLYLARSQQNFSIKHSYTYARKRAVVPCCQGATRRRARRA